MNAVFHQNNRRRLGELLAPDCVAVFLSGDQRRRGNDVFYDFEPDKNFLYLTGLDREDMALVLVRRGDWVTETLFLPAVDETTEKWFGVQLRPQEASQRSGITQLEDRASLERWLCSLFSQPDAPGKLMICPGPAAPGEAPDGIRLLVRRLREQFPFLSVESLAEIMTRLRSIKAPEEIARIREAAGLISQGLEDVRSHLSLGRMEYEMKAIYEGRINRLGGRCYGTVCAGGVNACCLHHNRPLSPLKEGDAFLIDVGAAADYYWADVSRTYPVSGRFSDRQRELYQIVLETQQTVISMVRPGIREEELQQAVFRCYEPHLKRLGLISQPEEVSRYYYHNIGHPLGLDVHDLRPQNNRVLRENMVYTVEPGLYVSQWGIGIRIEDDVLVTPEGCQVLTSAIPKELSQVEN